MSSVPAGQPPDPAAVPTFAPGYVLYRADGDAAPMATPGPTGKTPAQIRHAYGFDQISFLTSLTGGYDGNAGRGQTIAIVDAYDDPNILNDVQQFSQAFGLKKFGEPGGPTLTVVGQTGTSNLPGLDPYRFTGNDWEAETALDVEWAHAIAPWANILLVEANSPSDADLFQAVDTARNGAGVSAISMSWGGGEVSGESSYDSHFLTPTGHTGVTFVASSGDYGAPASYPAASPNVLAVGGTTLNLNADNTIAAETGWGGSGGGISNYEPLPTYQPGTYSNGVATGTSTYRMNPDVAYDSDPQTGFPVYDTFNNPTATPWSQFGGTSDAAPQWAALIAIANQGRAAAGLAALGGDISSQTLPKIYGLPSYDFYDIVSGTSTGTPNYSAGTGYDLVTGRGSPKANLIVQDLVNQAPPTVPIAPTGLTASVDYSGPITLSWNSVSNADRYNVYRQNDDGTWPTAPLFSTGATTAQNTGVTASHGAYTYRVTAQNSAGESPPSDPSVPVTAAVNTLFEDHFDPASPFPTSGWAVAGTGGNWTEHSEFTGSNNNVLSQTSTTDGDPKKAVISAVTTTTPTVAIKTRMRVDSWQAGEYARAGVSLYTDASGAGYGIAVRDRNGGQHNTIQFLNDGVTWGNQYTFNDPNYALNDPSNPSNHSLPLNKWFNIEMESRGNVLYANVWADGTAEPATWQYVQTGWTGRTSGSAALNGSSAGTYTGETHSAATVSFDDTLVLGGTPVTPVATGLAFTTAPQTFAAGTKSGTITVQLDDQNGRPFPAGSGGQVVSLSSSSGGGKFYDTTGSVITSITIAAGTSSASFTYSDTTAGSPTLTASAAGLTSATQTETVTPAAGTVTEYPAGGLPISVRGNSVTTSKLTIGQSVTIADINVKLYLTFPTDGSLYIHLVSPSGVDTVLSNLRGGNGSNFGTSTTPTTFDNEATRLISAGTAPFAGSYKPDGNLAASYGKDAKGTWTLYVEDRSPRKGTLNSWSLVITSSGAAASGPAMVSPSATNSSSGGATGTDGAVAVSTGSPRGPIGTVPASWNGKATRDLGGDMGTAPASARVALAPTRSQAGPSAFSAGPVTVPSAPGQPRVTARTRVSQKRLDFALDAVVDSDPSAV